MIVKSWVPTSDPVLYDVPVVISRPEPSIPVHVCKRPGVWWRWRNKIETGTVVKMPCGHRLRWRTYRRASWWEYLA